MKTRELYQVALQHFTDSLDSSTRLLIHSCYIGYCFGAYGGEFYIVAPTLTIWKRLSKRLVGLIGRIERIMGNLAKLVLTVDENLIGKDSGVIKKTIQTDSGEFVHVIDPACPYWLALARKECLCLAEDFASTKDIIPVTQPNITMLSTPKELELFWQCVLRHVGPIPTRALLKQLSALFSFDGKTATIGIKAFLFRKAQTSIPELEAAFQHVWGEAVKVSLVVVPKKE